VSLSVADSFVRRINPCVPHASHTSPGVVAASRHHMSVAPRRVKMTMTVKRKKGGKKIEGRRGAPMYTNLLTLICDRFASVPS
jgi:hypothetical protein